MLLENLKVLVPSLLDSKNEELYNCLSFICCTEENTIQKYTRRGTGEIIEVPKKLTHQPSPANVALARLQLPRLWSEADSETILIFLQEIRSKYEELNFYINSEVKSQYSRLTKEAVKDANWQRLPEIARFVSFEYGDKEKEKIEQQPVFNAIKENAGKMDIKTFLKVINLSYNNFSGKFSNSIKALHYERIEEIYNLMLQDAEKNPVKEKNNRYNGKLSRSEYAGIFLQNVMKYHLYKNGFKANVTKAPSGYTQSYNIEVLEIESPKTPFKVLSYKERQEIYKKECLSYAEEQCREREYWDAEKKAFQIDKIESLINDFLWDNSDAQTDYFHARFYSHVSTDKCKFVERKKEKPAKVGTNSAAAKTTNTSTATATNGNSFEVEKESGEKFIFEMREKYFLLKGDTFAYKDQIKSFFNAFWHGKEKGWMIKNEHLEAAKIIFC